MNQAFQRQRPATHRGWRHSGPAKGARHQRRAVQLAAQPDRHRYVVAGRRLFQLRQKPQPLLRIRQRHTLAAVDPGNRALTVDPTFSLGAGDPGGDVVAAQEAGARETGVAARLNQALLRRVEPA